MHRKHGVEEMRETNAMRLGHKPKLVSVAVEAPGLTVSHDFDAWLVMPI